MNSNQTENIEYKDINYSKFTDEAGKEQINPNIYYNTGIRTPRMVYSKKHNFLKSDLTNSTIQPKIYSISQNNFFPPSPPNLEEINKIKRSSFLENELKKLKMNYISLNNDNIILKEDINQLFDLNKQLEQELSKEHSNNYELAKENDVLNTESKNILSKIEEVNQKIIKIKNNYQKENEVINKQVYIEEKINEKDDKCKEILEENNKLNYEYNLLNNNYKKLQEKNEKDEKELDNLKKIQEQNLNEIENKLVMLISEMDKLKYENNELKKENENCKCNIMNNEREKNDYYNKYKEQKMKNEMINKEIKEIKEKYQVNKIELENKIHKENVQEKLRKNKSDNKINVIKDLHKKIREYKTERAKKKLYNKEDD